MVAANSWELRYFYFFPNTARVGPCIMRVYATNCLTLGRQEIAIRGTCLEATGTSFLPM